MRQFAILFFLFTLVGVSQSHAVAIGELLRKKDNVVVVRDGVETVLEKGDEIHAYDRIRTDEDGRAEIEFEDGSQLTLGFNTEVHIDEFVYNPDQPKLGKSLLNMVNGAFYYISGKIGKAEPTNVTLDTAYGTIGIRGTKVWGGMGMKGYGVFVEEGAVEVFNEAGGTFVPQGLGTHIETPESVPTQPKGWPMESIKALQAQILF